VRLKTRKRVQTDEAKSRGEEEEEEKGSIVDLKRHTQLAVAWNREGGCQPVLLKRIDQRGRQRCNL